MIAFVATVAIVNTLLGFFLTRWLWPSVAPRAIFTSAGLAADKAKNALPPAPIAGKKTPAASPPQPAKPVPSGPLAKPIRAEAPPPASSISKPPREAMHELRNIRDRLHYCKSTGEKLLVQALAKNLHEWAQAWHAKLLKCLVEGSEEMSLLFEDSDASGLEMYAAQVETCLTNIQMLDWNDDTYDILARLDREITLLERK
jgi:hypothetical protein